uniref:CCHC-type domain-containing protein n=1 Tax=Oryza punctata TaxID=4537 RepID=A0A0E0JZI0_ORYPU
MTALWLTKQSWIEEEGNIVARDSGAPRTIASAAGTLAGAATAERLGAHRPGAARGRTAGRAASGLVPPHVTCLTGSNSFTPSPATTNAYDTTICREWFHIDNHHLDKFHLLNHQFLHHTLLFLSTCISPMTSPLRKLGEDRKRKMNQQASGPSQRPRGAFQQYHHHPPAAPQFRTVPQTPHAATQASRQATPTKSVQGQGSQSFIRRCYNCKESGHLANNCPHPKNITPVKFNLGNTPEMDRSWILFSKPHLDVTTY